MNEERRFNLEKRLHPLLFTEIGSRQLLVCGRQKGKTKKVCSDKENSDLEISSLIPHSQILAQLKIFL